MDKTMTNNFGEVFVKCRHQLFRSGLEVAREDMKNRIHLTHYGKTN